MKIYGLEMNGPFIIEKMNNLTVWSKNDKGRIIWETSSEKFYFGGGTGWVEVGDASTISVGSDQDGDIYYRALGTLARLAKGTSNQKLFMDNAGDYPEWGDSSKIVSSNFNITKATGTTAVTGVGFKPSFIFCIACHYQEEEFSFGIIDYSLNNRCLFQETTNVISMTTSYCSVIDRTDGEQYIKITSLDDDGFTYTNTKVSSPTGNDIYLYFLCFR